jgi:hypothetical protein
MAAAGGHHMPAPPSALPGWRGAQAAAHQRNCRPVRSDEMQSSQGLGESAIRRRCSPKEQAVAATRCFSSPRTASVSAVSQMQTPGNESNRRHRCGSVQAVGRPAAFVPAWRCASASGCSLTCAWNSCWHRRVRRRRSGMERFSRSHRANHPRVSDGGSDGRRG